MGCSTIFQKKVIKLPTAQSSGGFRCFHGFLERFDKSLSQPVGRGVVGAEWICFTPFSWKNSDNSAEMNCGSLSETNCSGEPYTANRCLRTSMVLCTLVEVISYTSGHLEWASTTMKNILCKNGPAKSTCIRCQGLDGHVHGWSGADVGACLMLTHC